MNMKSTLSTAATAGALALLFASSANAIDIKAHHGSSCKVFGTTAWTDLGFGWQGINNPTDTPKVIVCPLVKDSEADWDGNSGTPVNAPVLDFHYRSAKDSKITCTVYTTRTNALTSSVTATIDIPAGTQSNTDLTGMYSSGTPNDVGTMMLCSLGSKVTLQHYNIEEQGLTDG